MSTDADDIASELGIGDSSELDDTIFAYISGGIRNKHSEIASFNGVIRENFLTENRGRTVLGKNYSADDIYLNLNKEFRGKGIAQKFTTQFMELLKKAGIKRINIDATMTDGGYAWARAGFNFAEKPDSLISRLELVEPYVKDKKFSELIETTKYC